MVIPAVERREEEGMTPRKAALNVVVWYVVDQKYQYWGMNIERALGSGPSVPQ